jgi:hypothetical protein
MQARDRTFEQREPRPGDLRRRLEVESQTRPDIDVIPHLEVERARRSPSPHFDVVVRRAARGYRFMRNVGNVEHVVLQPGLDVGKLAFEDLHLLRDRGDLRQHSAGVFSLGLQLADLLRQSVALGLQFLGAHLHRPALAFERVEAFDIEVEGTCLQPRGNRRDVLA